MPGGISASATVPAEAACVTRAASAGSTATSTLVCSDRSRVGPPPSPAPTFSTTASRARTVPARGPPPVPPPTANRVTCAPRVTSPEGIWPGLSASPTTSRPLAGASAGLIMELVSSAPFTSGTAAKYRLTFARSDHLRYWIPVSPICTSSRALAGIRCPAATGWAIRIAETRSPLAITR
ncbi:hypothetical protein ACFQY7_33190 [Actinomadura luteofluorescens]|uniref:hypothetical protein n=1 Tax=Actinomadura luteofluorescens TaxID=46163 RepID=UPI003631426A